MGLRNGRLMLKVGIVGLPNVGKSSLFNALTAAGAPSENYPFCTVEPNVGTVEVPDARLDRIHDLSESQTRVPTVIQFVDIAGLVEGASEGEGLGTSSLAISARWMRLRMFFAASRKRTSRTFLVVWTRFVIEKLLKPNSF